MSRGDVVGSPEGLSGLGTVAGSGQSHLWDCMEPTVSRARESSDGHGFGTPAGGVAPPCQYKNNSPGRVGRDALAWPLEAPSSAELVRGATVSVDACQRGAWSLILTDPATGETTASRFRCRSWRCPTCRYEVAKSDFRRMLEALESRTARRKPWVLITLTIDPKRYRDRWQAFRLGGRLWQRVRYRLARRYGSWRLPAKIEYLGVWERHRSGWPHVHLAISSAELVADIRRMGLCERRRDGFNPWRRDVRSGKQLPNWAWKAQVLDPLLVECGFGRVSDVQFPRKSEGGVAGYFSKLSAELVGMFDQRPLSAPRGFRRLRASLRLLPPRHRPGRLAGRLLKVPETACRSLLPRLSWPVKVGLSPSREGLTPAAGLLGSRSCSASSGPSPPSSWAESSSTRSAEPAPGGPRHEQAEALLPPLRA